MSTGTQLRSIHHVCNFGEREHPHPTPPHPKHPITAEASSMCPRERSCVAATRCASSANVNIPTPPHPTPNIPSLPKHPPCVHGHQKRSCVASTMCATSANVNIPTPPHPKHPINAEASSMCPRERSCVAATRCASSANVNIPTPPHPTHECKCNYDTCSRSIDHVTLRETLRP